MNVQTESVPTLSSYLEAEHFLLSHGKVHKMYRSGRFKAQVRVGEKHYVQVAASRDDAILHLCNCLLLTYPTKRP